MGLVTDAVTYSYNELKNAVKKPTAVMIKKAVIDDTRSLIDDTRSARVEPITIVSSDLINEPYIVKILQTTLNIVTGFYLQAVNLGSIKVNGVKAGDFLKRYNPTPTPILESYRKTAILRDDSAYKYGLPSLEDNISGNLGKNIEDPNLSVGQIVNVNIGVTDDNNKITNYTIPVMVKLSTAVMAPQLIVNLLTNQSIDKSLAGRFKQWQEGQISFIKDLILANDLIDSEKQLLTKKGYDAYKEILNRVNTNRLKLLAYSLDTVLSDSNDLAKDLENKTHNNLAAVASNIVIVSSDVINEIEATLGNKITSTRFRDVIFSNLYMMILIVVDKDWQRITIYYRNISEPTILPIKALGKSKNSGEVILDVLQSLISGTTPKF